MASIEFHVPSLTLSGHGLNSLRCYVRVREWAGVRLLTEKMFFDIADVLIGVVQSGGEREQLHSFSITGRLYSGLKTEMLSSVVNIPRVASDANYGHEFPSSGGGHRLMVPTDSKDGGTKSEITRTKGFASVRSLESQPRMKSTEPSRFLRSGMKQRTTLGKSCQSPGPAQAISRCGSTMRLPSRPTTRRLT